jgi:hypothetical protein
MARRRYIAASDDQNAADHWPRLLEPFAQTARRSGFTMIIWHQKVL